MENEIKIKIGDNEFLPDIEQKIVGENYIKTLCQKKTDIDKGKGEFTSIISSSSIDLVHEVLKPDGCIKKGFLKSILFNHNPNQVIGKSLNIWKSGNNLMSRGQIAVGVSDFIDEKWALIKGGFINGISVGFKILEQRRPTPQDIKEFGKGVRNVITKWQILEYSVTPIPCNQTATILGCKSLGIDPTIIYPDYKSVEVEDAPVIEVEDIDVDIKELMDMSDKLEAEIKSIDEDVKEETIKVKTAQDILIDKIKKELRVDYKNKEIVQLIKHEMIKHELFKNGKVFF